MNSNTQKSIYLRLSVFLLSFLFINNSFAFSFIDEDEFPQWSENAIEHVQEERIMTGFPDGSFKPDKSLSRAEALVLIFRTKGIDLNEKRITSRLKNFSDIASSAWYATAVDRAIENRWINGFSDGSFRPGKTLNKAEWATLLTRVYELESDEDNIPSFFDVPRSAWFSEPVFAMYNNDLLRYPNVRNFDPTQEVTRAEAAWVISQILDKPRLMGESEDNNFKAAGYRQTTSRRVAIRPSNFDANDQGFGSYTENRTGLEVQMLERSEDLTVTPTSDWTSIGSMKFTNNLDDPTEIDSIQMALRFDDNAVGPVQEFILRLSNPDFAKEVEIDRTGRAFFGGVRVRMVAGKSETFKVELKPKADRRFLNDPGEGKISIHHVTGTTTTRSTKNGGDRTTFKKTPIKYLERDLASFQFQP